MKNARSILPTICIIIGSLFFSNGTKALQQHVFFIPPTAGSTLVEFTYNNGWVENSSVGGGIVPANSTVAAFASGTHLYACFFFQRSGAPAGTYSVNVLSSTDNSNWTRSELDSPSIPPADINSGLTGFVDSSGNPRVFYVASANEAIVEVFSSNGGSTWQYDSGSSLGSVAASGTALAGYLFNGHPQVFYIGTNIHLYQTQQQGSTWFNTDVTVASGAPLPLSNRAGLLGYQFNTNGTVHVVATDHDVHQSWWNGTAWKTDNVTALAGAPLAGDFTALMGYMFNGQPTVNFIASDQHIHQMWWNGSKELTNDWTTLGGGHTPFADSPLTGYAFNGQSTVFYLSLTGQLRESFWNGSSTQDIELTTFGGAPSSPTGLASAIF